MNVKETKESEREREREREREKEREDDEKGIEYKTDSLRLPYVKVGQQD